MPDSPVGALEKTDVPPGGISGRGQASDSHLVEHLLRTGREALVSGRDEARPFAYESLIRRARQVWDEQGLERIGLHECRHTLASMCIAAGVNARGLMAYLGHASIQMTFDRYGHLMAGNEGEAAELLNAYLRRASGTARTTGSP